MNISTKAISMKYGLVLAALAIVAFVALRNRNGKRA